MDHITRCSLLQYGLSRARLCPITQWRHYQQRPIPLSRHSDSGDQVFEAPWLNLKFQFPWLPQESILVRPVKRFEQKHLYGAQAGDVSVLWSRSLGGGSLPRAFHLVNPTWICQIPQHLSNEHDSANSCLSKAASSLDLWPNRKVPHHRHYSSLL